MVSEIVRLKAGEVHQCSDGGRAFFAEGNLPGGFDPDVFTRTFDNLIWSGRGIVLASYRLSEHNRTISGALGGVLAPSPFNGKLMAVEMFWFVIEEYRGSADGIRLLKAFEQWAVEQRAEMISMIHLLALQPEKLGKLYQRMGYHPVETNYIKHLPSA